MIQTTDSTQLNPVGASQFFVFEASSPNGRTGGLFRLRQAIHDYDPIDYRNEPFLTMRMSRNRPGA